LQTQVFSIIGSKLLKLYYHIFNLLLFIKIRMILLKDRNFFNLWFFYFYLKC